MRGLRAGVQAEAAGGDHDVFQEHAVVEPTALLHVAVDREHEAYRGAKERVVARPLAIAGRTVAAWSLRLDDTAPIPRRAAARDTASAMWSGSIRTPASPGSPDANASLIACATRASAAPVSTCTFQGWMLLPLGARAAIVSSETITSGATGSGRNPRTLRREVIA